MHANIIQEHIEKIINYDKVRFISGHMDGSIYVE